MEDVVLDLGADADAAAYACTLAADPDVDPADVIDFVREALPAPLTDAAEQRLLAAVAAARAGDDDGADSAPATTRAAADASPSALLKALDLDARRARLAAQADADQAAATRRSASSEAEAIRPPAEAVQALADIYPARRDFLEHALMTAAPPPHDDVAAAAAWLADINDLDAAETAWAAARDRERAAAEEAAAADAAARAALVERFAAAPVTSSAAPARMWGPSDDAGGGRIRYRDGVAVSSKGEKYIAAPSKPEWDGGSRGKVLLKGKRGKGYA